MEKWHDQKTIATWIVIVLVFITLLAVALVKLVRIHMKRMIDTQIKESELKMAHQYHLVESNIVAQEQERIRIAADLHDSLIGKLTILRLKNQSEYSFESTDFIIGETIEEARRISHDLSPPMLEFLELDELLQDIAAPWQKYMHIYFYFNIDSNAVLHQHLKIQLARIVQELLTNIYKHAEASNVHINLKSTQNQLILTVSDNGKGFDTTEAKKGIGLNNIELRMVYLRGKHKIKSSPRGTIVTIAINHPKFPES